MRPGSDVVTLTVSSLDDGKMVVKFNMTSTGIEAASHPVIRPFMVKDTPSVLDEQLGEILAEPAEAVSAALTDIEEYRRSVKKAADEAKKTQSAASAKPAAKKDDPDAKRKEALKAAMDKGDKALKEKKFDDALKAFTEAGKNAKDDKEKKAVDDRISAVQKARAAAFNSFDFFDEESPAEEESPAQEESAEESPAEEQEEASEDEDESTANDDNDEDEPDPFEE